MNYKNIRNRVHSVNPPLIPFPGVYNADLVFLETCGKTVLEDDLINFEKLQRVSSYVTELQVYQKTPYNFKPVKEIQDHIKSFPTFTSEALFEMSLACEPKTTGSQK